MKLSPEALETMGESASDGLIHPYVWGPALVGAAQQIKELQAALSSAQADREALMEVVRHSIAMRSVVHDTDLYGLELEIAEQGLKDALDVAIDALPAHLRSEAEGKAKP